MSKSWSLVEIAWICTLLFGFAGRAAAQGTNAAIITAPAPDAPLLGQVAITGSTAIAGLQSWVLEFGYAEDPTKTWFLIAEGDQPIENDILADWDTTTITDGNYHLRLTVWDGAAQTSQHVIAVRVRNYTAIETATAPPVTATPADSTPRATLAPSRPAVTLTPLPTNPAELTPQDLAASAQAGIVVIIAAFGLLGIYLYLRQLSRR
jgi:hypothetical protein